MSESTIDTPPRLDSLAGLHEEVAGRLRHVCRGMPPEEFEALVREIVRVKVKYDTPRGRSG